MLFLTFQAFFILMLISAGLFQTKSVFIVFGILSFYWASGLTLLPPWNRLMGHTIPLRLRLKFFSMRLQLSQSSVVFGLLFAGASLYFAKKANLELECYLILFAICFILKILSIREFTFHQDYPIKKGDEVIVSPIAFIKRLKGTDQGQLILFLMFFYTTVYFSSPFFAPYMIKTLKFNYLKYMMITAMSLCGRIFMSNILKRFSKPKWMGTILFLGCLGVCTTPFMWVMSQNYAWLLLIEFISGCYWSMFDLSCLLLFFDKIRDQERTSIMTYLSFTNTLGMCAGTLLGGLFLSLWHFEADRYLSLFLCSSLVRFIGVLFIPTFQFKGFIKNWWLYLKK